ncbi:MAG TPA: SulP family inorganic anion transporter [Coriobacteriia bacterium]|nr:SulP family inorganic anion transporter [Coriobacteriia bacterium]
MPSIIEAWRAGLIRRDNLASNILAGVVVGIVALPLAMAFAIASGAKPEQGLYTALIAGLLVTLFGGTRVQIAGPTGAFAVLLISVTGEYGFAGLQVITLLAGGMLVLLGLTRLGAVIRFIPESVVLGFTAGIAIVIWIGQWQNFFGLPPVDGESLLQKLPNLLQTLPQLHPATTVLGVLSLAVLILWPRIPVLGKVPAPMAALVGGTLAMVILHPAGVATIGSVFGGIPRGLPPFTPPHFALSTVPALLQPAIAIALLGAIESLLSATVADGMIGTRHDPNQELIGQGVANMGAALFGGFAATGAIARTATNVRHGGTTPIAGIAHAATVAIVLVALAPLAFHVPLTTLAAVLFVVAYNMSDMGRVIRVARRGPRSDATVMLVTLVLAVFADISIAVEVGVILALLNFFRRMIAVVDVRVLGDEELEARLAGAEATVIVPAGVLVYSVEGPFFFGAAEQFESTLLHSGTDPRGVVIKLVRVPFIDLTGLEALKDVVESLGRRGIAVALCGATAPVAVRLAAAEISGVGGLPATATLAEALTALSATDASPDSADRA